MITFITDVRPGEKPFSPELFQMELRITDLDHMIITTIQKPLDGWSHEKLVAIAEELHDLTLDGADARLGTTWVGSTEV
jgi:hypothetical protein